MQSRRADVVALVIALVTALVCALLVSVWREGNAAILLEILIGLTLGFVFPRGAWRWAVVLAAWVLVLLVVKVQLLPAALPWCPQDTSSGRVPPWALALIPVAAVYAGVAADWIL